MLYRIEKVQSSLTEICVWYTAWSDVTKKEKTKDVREISAKDALVNKNLCQISWLSDNYLQWSTLEILLQEPMLAFPC